MYYWNIPKPVPKITNRTKNSWFWLIKPGVKPIARWLQQQIMHIAWVIIIELRIQCKCNWKVIFLSLTFSNPARGESISCWFNFNYYSIKCQSHSFPFWPMCMFIFLGSNIHILHTLARLCESEKMRFEKIFECCKTYNDSSSGALWLFFLVLFLSAFQLLCHYSNRHKRLWTH